MQSGRTEMALGAAERIATHDTAEAVVYVMPNEEHANWLRRLRKPHERVIVMGLARFQKQFEKLRPRLVVFDSISYMPNIHTLRTIGNLKELMEGTMEGPTQIIIIP